MRLTKKDDLFSGGYEPLAPYCDVTSKLGKLEDIEEELGIDLETLLKALKNGIYVKVGNKIKRTHWCISLNANGMYGERETYYWFAYRVNGFDFPDTYERLKLKDYGKTWALSKDELNK